MAELENKEEALLKNLLVTEEQYKHFKHYDVGSMVANMQAEMAEDGGEYRQSIPFNPSGGSREQPQYDDESQQQEYDGGSF